MVTKIKRQVCLDLYAAFPLRSYDIEKDKEKFFYPQVFKSYILTLSSKTFRGHVKVLGTELAKLTEALHADVLIFLGDTETPWLYQDNEYKPVREAQKYLTDSKVGKRFNGALQIDTAELATFTRHLAWLSRCNAALPYFHFTNPEQTIVGSVCKYGNLHFDTLNEQTDALFKVFMDSSKFGYGNEHSCTNWFDKTSAVSGRQTTV